MHRSTIAILLSLVLASIAPTSAFAYETYSTASGGASTGNCADCHGEFKGSNYTSNSDGTPWGDNLMGGHENFIGDNGNDKCDVCHTGNKSPALLNLSDNPAKPQGCLGCHGRVGDESGVCAFGMSDTGNKHCGSAAGLRNLHNSAGVTACFACHSNDNGATLVGEDELPFNYSLAGTISNPCTAENKFGATGLDNDGDGAYDGADSDCSPAAEPFTKTVALPDINSNGNADLALIRSGSVVAEIRDGQAGALLNTLYFFGAGFTPVTGVALSDADGNGVSELAVLATRDSDSRMVVEIRNVSGTAAARQIWFEAGHSPVAMTAIDADADGNTIPELAVLSTRNSDMRVLVEIKNAFGATNPNALWPEPGLIPGDPGAYTASDIDVVPDADSNGVPEVAVLLTRNSDSRIVVDIKNAAGTINSHDVWFMAGNTAIDLTVVADKDANNIPEVAVLSSRDSDGRNVVQIKNAAGDTLSSNVWFAPGQTAKQVGAVSDADNNGVPEVAVGSVRDSDSRILVEVKNATGAANTNSIWYSSGFTAQGMAILNDADNNSINEIAVLMVRDSDSRILVQGRNAAGSVTPIDYWFSP